MNTKYDTPLAIAGALAVLGCALCAYTMSKMPDLPALLMLAPFAIAAAAIAAILIASRIIEKQENRFEDQLDILRSELYGLGTTPPEADRRPQDKRRD